MNIAIIGYGKMGHRLEELAADYELNTVLILDKHNNADGEGITPSAFEQIDAAIDFSHPGAFKQNFKKLLKVQVPLVIGTTGWLQIYDDVADMCKTNNTPVLYGSNFSLGVQLFGKLIRRAGELFGSGKLFDATLNEVHHTQKADAPSGTAITLAEAWLSGASENGGYRFGIPENERIDAGTFHITSQRLGSVFGEHQLRINSEFDDIEITHRARSRNAFAAGALKAVSWIVRQEPGFYRLEEVVEQI